MTQISRTSRVKYHRADSRYVIGNGLYTRLQAKVLHSNPIEPLVIGMSAIRVTRSRVKRDPDANLVVAVFDTISPTFSRRILLFIRSRLRTIVREKSLPLNQPCAELLCKFLHLPLVEGMKRIK